MHGDTGLIVEPENSLALAEAILHLLKNPSFAREIARIANLSIKKGYQSQEEKRLLTNYLGLEN